jgi:DNA sulfur modification protein DndD
LAFDRLSAGERQLLATSLLWGLAKASGRPLPTIIDTPLGRLDSSHRRHLLDRYFPVASHQVILLSTDEEVDETSLARLKSHIGRSYTLTFDEQEHSTIVKPGYFWNHESTH